MSFDPKQRTRYTPLLAEPRDGADPALSERPVTPLGAPQAPIGLMWLWLAALVVAAALYVLERH